MLRFHTSRLARLRLIVPVVAGVLGLLAAALALPKAVASIFWVVALLGVIVIVAAVLPPARTSSEPPPEVAPLPAPDPPREASPRASQLLGGDVYLGQRRDWSITWFESGDGRRHLRIDPPFEDEIVALWGVGSAGQRITYINRDWPLGDGRVSPATFTSEVPPPTRLFVEWRDALGFHVKTVPFHQTRDYSESSA